MKMPFDDLESHWPERLGGQRVGALLHSASVNSNLVHSLDILKDLTGRILDLTALLGPQHGLFGQTQANMVEWQGFKHPRLGIPIFSLYGEVREPTPEMWSHMDVLLVDLQDVGARYYTYIWTMLLCMKSAARHGKTIVVCDRPNPISKAVERGSIWESEFSSFVGLHALPVRHGLTIGALARLFQKECNLDVDLLVLSLEEYEPALWWDETGLAWVAPSPNMPTLDTATVYPGMCLLEGTNISEGRGTTRPFEWFGAPFIDSTDMCTQLNSRGIPGALFRPIQFVPTFDKWQGELCHGAQLHVTDRMVFQPFQTAAEILGWLWKSCPDRFCWLDPPYEYEHEKRPIDILLGNGSFRPRMIEAQEEAS